MTIHAQIRRILITAQTILHKLPSTHHLSPDDQTFLDSQLDDIRLSLTILDQRPRP